MRSWKAIASLGIVMASLVGCNKSDDKTATAPVSATPAAPSSAGGGMMDVMKDKAAAATDKAGDMKNSMVSSATDAKDSTVAAAGNAKDAVVATAQKYYDQAKDYISAKNFTGASDMMTKLDSIKAQLPAEWSAKVDSLKAMLASAKASVSNAMPTTNP